MNDDGHVANFVETEQLVSQKQTLDTYRPFGKGHTLCYAGISRVFLFKFCANARLGSAILGAAWSERWLSQDQNGEVAKEFYGQIKALIFSWDLNLRLLLLIHISSN